MLIYRKNTCVISLLVIVRAYVALSKVCNQRDPCACEMDDGSGVIDISSLGKHDRTPRFKDVKYADDMGSMYFSYNPCGGFDEGTCSNAAVSERVFLAHQTEISRFAPIGELTQRCTLFWMTCSYMKEESSYQQIGNAGTGVFVYDADANTAIIAYSAPTKTEQIWTYVTLLCDPTACDPTLVPKGQGLYSTGPNAVYQMQMRSVCACPGMCNEDGAPTCTGTSTGLSGGLIVVIAFFSCVAIYIVGGISFMKFQRNATGTDVIPNKSVWTSLPGLVRDGVKFTFCRCRSGGRTYDKI